MHIHRCILQNICPLIQTIDSQSFLVYSYAYFNNKVESKWSYSCNRLWRPIELWDVDAGTVSR
jgi:hypothetical protein